MLLGERHVWKGSGIKRRCITKEDNVFYIPVLETLQSLLNNETVLLEVCFLQICLAYLMLEDMP